MRFFQNVREALFEVERDLVEMGLDVWPKSMQNKEVYGDTGYQTKELIGYSFKVHDANSEESSQATADFYKEDVSKVRLYCQAEMKDRLNFKASNPGSSYLIRPEVWEQFLVGGKFDYTYSERMVPTLQNVMATLQNDPYSRQAIIPIFHPSDLEHTGGKRRIPCSMYYQMMFRHGRLNMIYTMRSCDIYTHFGYDVTLAIMFGERIVDALASGIPVDFTMFIGSLHAYRKDYEPRGVF